LTVRCRRRGEALVGQHAQDLGLGGDRHVGDLVEEQVPPCACSSRPGGRGRPPSSTPNNSSSTRSGVIRAALTMTKGAFGALAPAVEQPRGDFLADAGRAGDQHAAAGGGDTLQRGAHAVDRDWNCRSGRFRPTEARKRRTLAPQPLGLGRARDQVEQAFGLERLLDEIDAPGGSRRPRCRDCRGPRSPAPGSTDRAA
jgi:hypothetical protein